jgi:hypothetical protein
MKKYETPEIEMIDISMVNIMTTSLETGGTHIPGVDPDVPQLPDGWDS